MQRHPASLDKILELVLSDSLVGNLAKFFWDSLFSKTFAAGKLQALQVLSHPLRPFPLMTGGSLCSTFQSHRR